MCARVSKSGRSEGCDDGVEGTTRLAKQLEIAERELENLREREDDARGEAGRATEELQRMR